MYCGRVGGQLAVTRAIEDRNLKRDGVIAKPSIKRLLLKPTDKWLIIATDGVWDWFDEKDLLEIVNKDESSVQSVAREVVRRSLEQGSKDNITCLVIRL